MDSTWAWRLPSALQGLFSIISILILPFVPESPRWLAYQDRNEEALEVAAIIHANGDVTNQVALAQYKEILDTIAFEKDSGKKLTFVETVKTPGNRRRMLLMLSVAFTTSMTGYVTRSYLLVSC